WLTVDGLPRAAVGFAIAIAASHVANLSIPFPPVRVGGVGDIAMLTLATLVLSLPFIASGIVVTVALTRTGAPIGVMYGADLLGAAAGCLGVIGLLNLTDIASAALLTAAVAAGGAACFARAASSAAK